MRFRSSVLGLCVGLLVLTAAAYSPVLWCDFVNFDDDFNVVDNAHVAQGLTPASIHYAWTTFEGGNWIPLTWLSFMLDASLFGIRPFGFHLTNVLWHTVNVCLLFIALHALTGCTGRSVAAAALFAVHPLHVESVAWVSERKDVLSACGLLLALIAYEKYAGQPHNLRRYLCVTIAFALGLLAKSMLVTLPILLLLLDFWPLRRWNGAAGVSERYPPRTVWQLVREKIPWLMMSLADGLITIAAQKTEGAVMPLDEVAFPWRLANGVRALGWYTWKTFWPTNLCFFYPHPGTSIPAWQIVGSAALLMAITGFALRYRRSHGYLLTGWLWFVISMLPVLGILQVGGQAQADRYVYIPHIGLFVAVVWGAWSLIESHAGLRWPLYGGVLLAVSGCLLLTRFQIETWANSEALWRNQLRLYPDHVRAHFAVAMELIQSEHFDEAEPHFRRALEVSSFTVPAALLLADIYARREEWEHARQYFQWALRLDPANPTARSRLPAVQARLGDSPPRLDDRKPCSPDAERLMQAGGTLIRAGDLKAALRSFLAAESADPGCAEVHDNIALIYAELRQFDRAEQHFRQAIDLNPTNSNYRIHFGSMLEKRERLSDAAQYYEAALQQRGVDVEIRFRLDRISRQLKNP